jgi:hypothetical protein
MHCITLTSKTCFSRYCRVIFDKKSFGQKFNHTGINSEIKYHSPGISLLYEISILSLSLSGNPVFPGWEGLKLVISEPADGLLKVTRAGL